MNAQRHRLMQCGVIIFLALMASGVLSVSALAGPPGPGWELSAHSYPTNIAPGHAGTIEIEVFNIGAGDSHGPVTVTDVLPPGVTAIEAGSPGYYIANPENYELGHGMWDCKGDGSGTPPQVAGANVVSCTNDPIGMPSLFGGAGLPGAEVGNSSVAIRVAVANGAKEDERAPEENRVSVSGGGAPTSASTVDPVTISSAPAAWAFTGFDVWFSNADGTLDTQAGSHPYAATFSFGLPTYISEKVRSLGALRPAHELRNVEVQLPPGLIGNPTAVPRCNRADFIAEQCPNATQVGDVDVANTTLGSGETFQVFNLVPPPGDPAEFAFKIYAIDVFLDSGVRSGSDYGITTHVNDAPQRGVYNSVLVLWGNPADHTHDTWRTPNICRVECEHVEGATNKPFLTLPTACAAPQKFIVRTNNWENPEEAPIESSVVWHDSNGNPTGLGGCEHLNFDPLLTTAPDTANADTPAGLTVEVKPPVGGLSTLEGLSTADIQNTTVTLPEGLVINPGQAAGLQACPETEASLKSNDQAPVCPSASKVGTDEIETPLLQKPLQGSVYILPSDPPSLKLLVAASGEGVNLKLVGHVHLDEATGRLVSTFSGTPELPFTNFKLAFSGGAQAALATPTTCATYITTSDFDSWASPFLTDVYPTSSFQISRGTDGGPCPSLPLPFTPTLSAGSSTDQAGGFTSFSMLLQSADDQQRIEKLQFKIPSGLLGMISKVSLCPEPQAAQGTCEATSQIGHTTVASGPGPYPLVVPQPGQPPAAIYLTGPYKGAPFGLSIVVPVVVGPFTLQTQIVRAAIEVDPLTSQITVTTDPLPQIIDGVPTDLRTVNAVIDRPGFMFNPTNCSPMSFSGTAWGTPPVGVGGRGSTAAISSHFQMGSCRSLTFKPNFEVSTSGRTSRSNGASLDAKIIYPTGPLGDNQASGQSNIRSIKVDLPRQLPSRLNTLQKACTFVTFEANPAKCPPDSRVGTATAVTPVLPVPLTGPAYFVSYGGAKFPELVFALQGYGVTVDVHGETYIDEKTGVTSSTFRKVPDVPISSFELQLPEGPYSALAANGDLCKSALVMPTSFVAQNGATLKQNTRISVSGCAKRIGVVRHTVKNSTVTLLVSVPSAGRLSAGGPGLSSAAKRTNGAGNATLKLALSKKERALLGGHAGRRLSIAVKLLFVPTHGGKLSSGVTVLIG